MIESLLRNTDSVVDTNETVTDKHIAIDGDWILEPNGHLTLIDCATEVVGKRSREHRVDWRGGNVTT